MGHKIERAETLFFNGNSGAEYVRASIGLLSTRHVLIPVQDVALDRAARSLTFR